MKLSPGTLNCTDQVYRKPAKFWATEGLNFIALLFSEAAEHFWRRAELDLRRPAHAKFENAALFQDEVNRPLLSEKKKMLTANGAFRKRFSNRENRKSQAYRFQM